MKKIILIPAVVIAILVLGLIYFFYQLVTPAQSQAENVFFVIEKGQGVNEISQDLQQQGLIRDKLVFKTYLWLKGIENKLQAGEYDLNTGMNIRKLSNALISSSYLSQERQIKIIEGWTAEEIDNYLAEIGMFPAGEFLKYTNNAQIDYTFLPTRSCLPTANCPEPIRSLEGYLFPDTYRIFKKATISEVVKKMLDNFDKRLTPELREEIRQQGRTIREVMILASILEKEVRAYEDRQMVADVFLKRLQADKPLQSDATVNYITKKKTTRPSLEDVSRDSPYNTYKNKGLPPGPICNPGLDSIKAAIYPKANDYYYFLTKDDGTVIWSKTGEEHEANKQKYLD